MKYLKSETAYRRWARQTFAAFGPDKTLTINQNTPEEYPCYAALEVSDWGYQETRPVYLYARDAAKLLEPVEQ